MVAQAVSPAFPIFSQLLTVVAHKSLLSRARKQAVPYTNFCKLALANCSSRTTDHHVSWSVGGRQPATAADVESLKGNYQ